MIHLGENMANVKKGDLVKLEYTGRLVKTGQIFDTTDEAIAKQAGIWESSAIYGPKHALFGSGAIIPGMEDAVLHSQLGKSEDFVIEPKQAFGERDNDRILNHRGHDRDRDRGLPACRWHSVPFSAPAGADELVERHGWRMGRELVGPLYGPDRLGDEHDGARLRRFAGPTRISFTRS